ncbi:MAG TPA: glycosyltransferase [Solirubrobacteraceae bacterium]|jgi:glycosyltransferase involved in cell wall biosynthesis|nr:glycosyltransferase [Solirubrobacteraceae bacterium]
MRLNGQDIVCVSYTDWKTDLLTNQNHLMVRVARANRVLFVESLGLRRPQLAGRDVKRMARRLVKGLRAPREVDGLRVLAPLVLPLHSNALARRFNAWLLPRLVRRAARRMGMRNPLLWSFVPQAEVLVEALQPSRIVYYCDDDHAATKGIDAASFRAAEERFARRADLVLASSPMLLERMRALNDRVLYAPNMADTELFSRALDPGPVDPAIDALPRPRVLFCGAVEATRIDVPLLAELARARPTWSFPLVGPVGAGDPRTDVGALRELPNVHLLGFRPYTDLPSVMRGADAGIIPYRLDGPMGSVFPMKVHEYLAAGLPFVSTPLPALRGVDGVVEAADAGGMAAALDEEMATDTAELRHERSERAAAHSYDARLEEIGEALSRL